MSDRPETGPMQFGDDWRGVFIRGDNAGWYALNLRMVLDTAGEAAFGNPLGQLRNLLDDLEGSDQRAVYPVQLMKAYDECVQPMDSGNPNVSEATPEQA